MASINIQFVGKESNSPISSCIVCALLCLLVLSFNSCSYYYTHDDYQSSQMRVLDNGIADSALIELIAPYKMAIDSEMHAVVGNFEVDMKRGKPESNLGNFICDVLLKEGASVSGNAIDFAVYNYGGIRQEIIGKGPVTKGKIYELLPFENFGAIVILDGHKTAQLIQKIVDEKGWPVGGIRLVVKDGHAEDVMIGDMPFDSTRTYSIIMNDYMANGGDNLSFISGSKVQVLGITVRDMVLNYMQSEMLNGRSVYEQIEGRITYAE